MAQDPRTGVGDVPTTASVAPSWRGNSLPAASQAPVFLTEHYRAVGAAASHPATALRLGVTSHFYDFVAGWRSHDVHPRPTLRKRLHHPELGELELDRQTLLMPGTNLRLVLYTADPGSPSATALAQRAPPDAVP
ncbi:MmyB family transcriptional regulator [Streptomyces clavifer]|uniref:MmyB family transcriptional regulator n=1 Tax=Streptomyces clavifer TaxID=68188 RepID=UPI00380F06A3